ncbi:adenosine deaminase [Amycolatopsis nigrescens]|uniref:adenosine deaminase n=1 Tax=Amycolatopsis nigrescens TaxID=381445 RepID=UPI0003656ABE|nr:adenosine deaminase [Amycolatopsis nigrescens]
MNTRCELHCHLDGSVRPGTIAELAAAQGIPLTRPVEESVVAPPVCASLPEYIGYFALTIAVLQTPDALHRAARELVHDWHRDGIGYGEVRFAPQQHEARGMSMDDAVLAVADGLAAGRAETGVRTGLLLCCLRQQQPSVGERVAETAIRHRDRVVALDLAGDERCPGTPQLAAFDAARDAGLAITIHAGEAAGPESVWEAVDVLGAARIGHGVRAAQDAALLERLRRDRIALEMCPTSNVQTRAVASLAEHPADRLLAAGLAVTISTDAHVVSDTTVTREFERLGERFGWTARHEERCQANARAAAFG